MTSGSITDGLNQEPVIDWSQVWKTHGRWLRTVLLARLRDWHAVDEVFQDMALLVVRKPHRWPQPEKLGPWLYRVAIRQVQLFRRQNSRAGRRLESADSFTWERQDENATDPSVWLMDQEAEALVRVALERMNDQDREILMLKHTEHWTYGEISDQLGISFDKVVYRLGRAREAMKRELVAQCNEWSEKR